VVEATAPKQRTLGAGASYSTNFGAGGNVFWEHRNAFGGGERARVELSGTEVEQALTGSFRKPLQRPGAVIDYQMELAHEDNEAFESTSATIGFAYDRPFWRDNRLSTGVEVEAAEITDPTGKVRSLLLSTPVELYRNTFDDRLNPTRGLQVSVSAAPHAGDGGLYFGLFEATAAQHHSLREDGRLVASGWSRLGFTLGPDTFDLPATKRFYAGGAGSVRGFGYRLAGPLDEDGDPLGGRSVWEAGGEMRMRVRDSYGVVAFLEGGAAFDAAYPDFQTEPLIGAGVGARYYTAVGPIRFDVAFPINRRDGVDDAFQIYISIGQAF
ncbi:MAG: BamA/TamA family outer membrane protein, partial [Pseudomonadota bacterium]